MALLLADKNLVYCDGARFGAESKPSANKLKILPNSLAASG